MDATMSDQGCNRKRHGRNHKRQGPDHATMDYDSLHAGPRRLTPEELARFLHQHTFQIYQKNHT